MHTTCSRTGPTIRRDDSPYPNNPFPCRGQWWNRSMTRPTRPGTASAALIASARALYRANIRYVDDEIGTLIERLKREGLYERSLIIFMSDHGDAFFEHRRFGHNATLYDEMLRIPLLMKFPKRAGVRPRRVQALAETIDVMPTVLDFLGLPVPDVVEGESLWPLIEGRATQLESPRYACVHRTGQATPSASAATSTFSIGKRGGRSFSISRSTSSSVRTWLTETRSLRRCCGRGWRNSLTSPAAQLLTPAAGSLRTPAHSNCSGTWGTSIEPRFPSCRTLRAQPGVLSPSPIADTESQRRAIYRKIVPETAPFLDRFWPAL